MAGLNKVQIIGRLGRDPEVRNFSNGGKVVNLRIATSERWKDKNGEQVEKTEWHAVSIFNEPLGDVAEKYLRKGNEVYVEGQLETRKWQDQSGADRYSTEVVLRPFRSQLVLIGGNNSGDNSGSREDRGEDRGGRTERGGGGGAARGGASGGSGWDAPRGAGRSRPTDLDEDIPFGPSVL